MRILKVGRIWNFSICFLTALAFFIFSKASAENLELGEKTFRREMRQMPWAGRIGQS